MLLDMMKEKHARSNGGMLCQKGQTGKQNKNKWKKQQCQKSTLHASYFKHARVHNQISFFNLQEATPISSFGTTGFLRVFPSPLLGTP